MERKPVQLPKNVHEELTEIQKIINYRYGLGLSLWETISFLIRFFKENLKENESRD